MNYAFIPSTQWSGQSLTQDFVLRIGVGICFVFKTRLCRRLDRDEGRSTKHVRMDQWRGKHLFPWQFYRLIGLHKRNLRRRDSQTPRASSLSLCNSYFPASSILISMLDSMRQASNDSRYSYQQYTLEVRLLGNSISRDNGSEEGLELWNWQEYDQLLRLGNMLIWPLRRNGCSWVITSLLERSLLTGS